MILPLKIEKTTYLALRQYTLVFLPFSIIKFQLYVNDPGESENKIRFVLSELVFKNFLQTEFNLILNLFFLCQQAH
ncbi:hypothetical protein BpHYR1_039318 [Brachionus plicatilis]|uniref:Uncharacterized protein n=1 Tax=Brachionus plicatilis TaxID=10195 RepID=A0A3M7QPA9_BRAPC|nr:hypothetical protein BpHYR1_039318 [Brachionus plicatilis]